MANLDIIKGYTTEQVRIALEYYTETLGIRTPLLASSRWSFALACGVLVPIPTFWANKI